jgi:hypothetical protein
MRLFVVVTILLGVASGSQQTAVPVGDASRPGSPVVLSGTACATDEGSGVMRYSVTTNVSATNVSRKDILLMVAKVDAIGISKIDLHATTSNEYFFVSDVFRPNMTETLTSSVGPVGEPREPRDVTVQPENRIATASVVFVQFLDGSTWGVPASAKTILLERRLTQEKLASLAETYRTKGEKQFLAQLMEPSRLQAIVNLQQFHLANGNGAGTVIQKITSMLNCADLHERAMHRSR